MTLRAGVVAAQHKHLSFDGEATVRITLKS
jgi:hypothetical protein